MPNAKPIASPSAPKLKPTGKRQRLPAEKRRQQLIDAAQKVFVHRGYHGTRTRDIAKEAEVNEATLFLYFKSKQDMFEAAVTEPLREIVKLEIAEARQFGEATDAAQRTAIAHAGIAALFGGMTVMTPLLIAAIFSEGDLGEHIYRHDVGPLMDSLRENVMAGMHVDDAADAEFIVLAAFALSFMFNVHHRLTDKPVDTEATVRRITAMFLNGALPAAPTQSGKGSADE